MFSGTFFVDHESVYTALCSAVSVGLFGETISFDESCHCDGVHVPFRTR